MKPKCPLCENRKAQRLCTRQDAELICSVCCAEMRGPECGDCRHYAESQKYRAARTTPKSLRDGHFLAEFNPDVDQKVQAALQLVRKGAFDKALPMLTKLRREHSRNHTVCFAMGTLHAMKGEDDKAMPFFDKAIEIFPYMSEAHFNRAVIFKNRCDLKNAVRAFEKVVEIGPEDDPDVRKARSFIGDMAKEVRKHEGVDLAVYLEVQDEFDRAFESLRRGEWSIALEGFRAVAAKTDRNAPTHGNMGLCLAKLGHKAEALAELDRALEIDPGYQPARINRIPIAVMEEGKPCPVAGGVEVEFNKDRLQNMPKPGVRSFFDRILHHNRKAARTR